MDLFLLLTLIGLVVSIIGVSWPIYVHTKNKEKRRSESHVKNLPESDWMSTNTDSQIVVAIGSGVSENVYKMSSELRIGQKHIVERYKLKGGSGLNYTFRLMNMGIPVLPILSVGNDSLGFEIRENIKSLAEERFPNSPILKYIKSEEFLCEDFSTPESTIMVYKDERTILTEKLNDEDIEKLQDHIFRWVDRIIKNPALKIKAVMIGHIYGDDKKGGEITKTIIDKFSQLKESIIFANFGASQISLGVKQWKKYLRKITVLQLSLSEVRDFFREEKNVSSLIEIIKWFKKRNITIVITMDKFGAVATYKNKKAIILAWPFELGEKLVDTTGSGDAFGSGITSVLYSQETKSDDFFAAVEEARKWAAFACTTLGGAEHCPNKDKLDSFVSSVKEFASIAVQEVEHVDLILRILDRAY